MDERCQSLQAESKSKGILCTGAHGLLLASSGIADASRAGFLASLYAKAESLHQDEIFPVVTIETTTM
jgi:hypothetical protein